MPIETDINPSSGSTVYVAQALHGYRNGHELLATSLPLSRNSSRVLLVLSDLSGSAARIRGFESYMTGYALSDDRLYAFARTWLATEEVRPGSVWTHTLLLTPEQLEMQGVTKLARWFRRPASSGEISEYANPLDVSEAFLGEREFESMPLRLRDHDVRVDTLYDALYGNDSSTLPILLPAESSSQYEALVLYIWSLQWPALREHFSFCTGALSFRQVGGQPFDLQVVPRDRLGTIERSAPSRAYVLVDEHRLRSASATSTDDLPPEHGASGQLGAFVWQFGTELDPERLSLGRLARLHRDAQDLSDRSDWQSLLEAISTWYPRRGSAPALKSWALNESAASLADPLKNHDRLLVLSRMAGASAFTGWPDSLADAFLQALSVPEAKFGAFLSEFPTFATAPACDLLLGLSAEHLSGGSFVAVIGSSQEPVAWRAFALRPSILAEPALWRSERARRWALTWLRVRRIDEQLIGETVRAVVTAGQPVGLGDLAELAGPHTIDAAFDVLGEEIERDGALQAVPEWLATLRAYPKRGVSWLARSERPASALAGLVLEPLQPGDRRISVLGISRWRGIVRSIDSSTTDGMSVHVFALGVGFHDERPSASSLVAELFQMVHESAEQGRLNAKDWDKLERALPVSTRVLRRLTRSGERGRARALRGAIVEAFEHRGWPAEVFLAAVNDTAVLSRIVTENVRTRSGRVLGRRLKAAIQSGELVVSDRQRTALGPWIASSGWRRRSKSHRASLTHDDSSPGP